MDAPSLTEVTRTIVEHFDPLRIVLFGSRARSEQREESDLDLFVEMESDLSPPERAAQISALFGLRRWALDVLVYTPEEVRRARRIPGTVLSHIEAEGDVLYERS